LPEIKKNSPKTSNIPYKTMLDTVFLTIKLKPLRQIYDITLDISNLPSGSTKGIEAYSQNL